jgi:hypothetical protein
MGNSDPVRRPRHNSLAVRCVFQQLQLLLPGSGSSCWQGMGWPDCSQEPAALLLGYWYTVVFIHVDEVQAHSIDLHTYTQAGTPASTAASQSGRQAGRHACNQHATRMAHMGSSHAGALFHRQ